MIKRFTQHLILALFAVSSLMIVMNVSHAFETTDSGIVKVASNYSVLETADRFEAILQNQGLTQFARVNHTAGAQSVDLELRPTEVIIFGNPQVGTPLMQCNQLAAIDLPQKALIWQAEDGQVWIGYNNPDYLLARHALDDCSGLLGRIQAVLRTLTETAAQ